MLIYASLFIIPHVVFVTYFLIYSVEQLAGYKDNDAIPGYDSERPY